MNDIEFGLKLWSLNYGLIGEAANLVKDGVFDYVELMVVPGTDISVFQKAGIPFIIHVASENWGVNIADESKEKSDLKTIKECLDIADELNAKYLILHPGFGDFETAKKLLGNINDKRIVIENMPKVGMGGEPMIGWNPEQIVDLCQDKFGFCLDFGHAVKAAASLNKNYRDIIDGFLKLKPAVCHISDGFIQDEKDSHLAIGDGDYDLKFFLDRVQRDGIEYVTLETPRRNLDSLAEDLGNLRRLKSFPF